MVIVIEFGVGGGAAATFLVGEGANPSYFGEPGPVFIFIGIGI